MKDRTYFLNTALAGVVGAGLLGAMIARTMVPNLVLPELNIPAVAALSLAALMLEAYFAPNQKQHWPWLAVLGAATFGLLPWIAGAAAGNEIWKLALAGGGCFTAVTWLFDTMGQRLASGRYPKLSLWIGAFVLYLAFQCFTNVFL